MRAPLFDPQPIMAAYRDAYQRANGTTVQIDYCRGWFSIFSGGMYRSKHRRREIEAFTEALLYRAARRGEVPA